MFLQHNFWSSASLMHLFLSENVSKAQSLQINNCSDIAGLVGESTSPSDGNSTKSSVAPANVQSNAGITASAATSSYIMDDPFSDSDDDPDQLASEEEQQAFAALIKAAAAKQPQTFPQFPPTSNDMDPGAPFLSNTAPVAASSGTGPAYTPVSAEEITHVHQAALPGLECLQGLSPDRNLVELINDNILTPDLMPKVKQQAAFPQQITSMSWLQRLAVWFAGSLHKFAKKLELFAGKSSKDQPQTHVFNARRGDQLAFEVSARH